MTDAVRRRALRAAFALVVVAGIAIGAATAASAASAAVVAVAGTPGTTSPSAAAPAEVFADDPLPAPQPSPDEANRRADEILADPEYQPPSQTVIQRVEQWLGERLAELVSSVLGGGAGSIVSWIIIGLAVGLIAFFVSRIGRTVQPEPQHPSEASVEVRRSTADWRAEAERCEAAGDWRGGLRCRYRALVVDLVRREVLRDIPGRTSGEYRGELAAARPSVASEFAGASELFERAWYGNLPTGPAERERFRELADVVEREVTR